MSQSKLPQRWAIYAFSTLFVFLSLFTTFGERGMLHLWRLWGEQRELSEKNFLMQKENEILRERIYRLRHDDRYLEKISREELGLVRPGEIIYRFAASESKENRSRTIDEFSLESSRPSGQKSRP